jgi:hypothetical protein
MLMARVLDCFGALRSKFIFSKVLLQKVVQECTNDTNSSEWSNIQIGAATVRTMSPASSNHNRPAATAILTS